MKRNGSGGPLFQSGGRIVVQLAEHILDTTAGHFDPAEFEDRYENAVVEMLKQKQAGMPVRKEAPVAAPFDSREFDGCVEAVHQGRTTGSEEGQGRGEGQ
jgi:non-homologous end joining protein Ku